MNQTHQNSQEPWEPLASAFREELSECAHLLVLLEEQQSAMLERRFVDVGEHDTAVTTQLHRLQLLRSNSQALYSEFSDGGDLARDREHWDRFLEDLPMGARELFRALRHEMRQQFRRLQRLSQENLALLTSAREAYGELLRRVVPTTERPAYDARGRSHSGYRMGPRSFASLA